MTLEGSSHGAGPRLTPSPRVKQGRAASSHTDSAGDTFSSPQIVVIMLRSGSNSWHYKSAPGGKMFPMHMSKLIWGLRRNTENHTSQTSIFKTTRQSLPSPISTPGWEEAANGPYSTLSTCVHNQANQNRLWGTADFGLVPWEIKRKENCLCTGNLCRSYFSPNSCL